MKLPTFNGWFSWSFNGELYTTRKNKNCEYKFHIANYEKKPKMTYKEALYYNATMCREYYSDKFDLMLSGGIDSEVIARTFKDLGIKHNTVIFRYENDINYKDVNSAIEICQSLNLPYKIIDFNLQKFFENDAYDLFLTSNCIRAGRIVHLKLCDLVDNIPVMGEGEPYWKRSLGDDYSKKSEWLFPLNESNHNCSMYLHSKGRENICDWYEFTPYLIKAFNEHPIIKKLLNDELNGKLSNWTSRIPIHREIWPDIKFKHKLTGYEGEKFTGTYPEFIMKFQKIMENQIGKGNEYWLNIDELSTIFY